MDIEQRIIEQRTTEATKKNLIGYEGKIYLIARFLGDEIIKQNEEQQFLNYDDFQEDEIQTLDENTITTKLGYFYTGSKHANNIEIYTDDYFGEIKVFYKGFLCYKETSGLLETYVPNECWENTIEELYNIIQPKIKNYIKKKAIEEQNNYKMMEDTTIADLRKKWGDII
jgi:hypothetical protein